MREGRVELTTAARNALRTDLGVGQVSRTIVYGSSTPGTAVNQNVTIPDWAVTFRIQLQGSGAGGNSGAVQPTTTTAVSGGGSGAAGCFAELQGNASDLFALGGTIALSLGSPGLGGAATTTTTGNLGGGGNPATATIAGTTVLRAGGGTAATAFASGGANALILGGVLGSNGVAGTAGAGNAGSASAQLYIPASGGSGGGIAASGSAQQGGNGNRGGNIRRNPVEAVAATGAGAGTAGANAAEILVAGIPVPGNSPSGGNSSITGNGGRGGDGINGSSGAGGGSSRSGSSGAGGNGGRSFAVVEFFGASPNTLQIISTPIVPGGRLTGVSGSPDAIADALALSTIFYTPFAHNVIPLFDGSVWINRVFSEIAIALTGLAANTNHDIFLSNTTGTFTPSIVAWTNNSTRSVLLARQDGILVRTGQPTQRYLGTIRTTSTIGQTEDSLTNRFIFNAENRVMRELFTPDSGAGANTIYTISSGDGFNAYRNSVRGLSPNPNQIRFVAGLPTNCFGQIAYQMGNAGGVGYCLILMNGVSIGDAAPFPSPSLYLYGQQGANKKVDAGYYEINAAEMAFNGAVNFFYQNVKGFVIS